MFDKIFSKNELRFIGYFFLVFLCTAGLLAAFGLLPNELEESSNGDTLTQAVVNSALKAPQEQQVSPTNPKPVLTRPQTGTIKSTQKVIVAGNPTRLIIPAIGLDTTVYTPKNTDVDTLDHDLTKGPVYYPGSGTPAGGNMFIFGHSTGYKVVINKAYKVFNDLHLLTKGDTISVVSNGNTFIYKVKSVSKVNKDETLVKFDTDAHLLTLSTCNSFGAKTDRYVVVADYVGVR
jgi:LPXTG-site transpeptidase (sortase) family protein